MYKRKYKETGHYTLALAELLLTKWNNIVTPPPPPESTRNLSKAFTLQHHDNHKNSNTTEPLEISNITEH